MRLELVTMVDERGVAIWFVDERDVYGVLVASEFFVAEYAAMAYLSLVGG
jgi:hypothetical protein